MIQILNPLFPLFGVLKSQNDVSVSHDEDEEKRQNGEDVMTNECTQ